MKEYSQKNLIEAFKEGNVPGENSVPRRRKTVISNVFLFKDRVYKIYKNDSKFYNENFRDISTKEERFEFTKKDFKWNQGLASDIYLDLKGVKFVDGKVEFVEEFDLAEELVIVMRRFKERSLLSNWLSRGNLQKENFFEIGKQLGEVMGGIPTEIDNDRTLSEIMISRKKDVEDWNRLVENKHISTEVIDEIFKVLEDGFSEYIENINDNKDKGACPDVHLENLVYENGMVSVIDSYSPKEEWETADSAINFYRVGSDVYMLAGEESFNELKKGYISSGTYLNDKSEDFLLLYSSLIDWPYLYMLGEKDSDKLKLAEKFGDSLIKKYLK